MASAVPKREPRSTRSDSASLIEELQRDALDSRVPVTELLQKCLVVGGKLAVDDLADWARQELDGYKDISAVPAYRDARGAPEVRNPYRGYQPLMFSDAHTSEKFSLMHFNQPVSELEFTLRECEKTKSVLRVSYPAEVEAALMEAMEIPLTPYLCVHAGQIHKMLEAVRRIVLEWGVRLENAGINGDGMSFSIEEKQRAKSVVYNVENYFESTVSHSQVGTVNSTQHNVSSNLDITALQRIIDRLKTDADNLGLSGSVRDEFDSEITTLEAQAASPKPKRAIITEGLRSIRSILEQVSGNLIASAAVHEISKYL